MNSTISRTWSFAVAVLLSAVLLWAGSASALTMITAHLDFGATGGNVTSLQQFLAADASIYPEGLVTGYFGSLTRAAVQRYQCKQGIVCGCSAATTGYGRVQCLNWRHGDRRCVGSSRKWNRRRNDVRISHVHVDDERARARYHLLQFISPRGP